MELGTSFSYVASGVKRRLVEKSDTFQYIPLLENLEWLLQNRHIYDEVSHIFRVFYILQEFSIHSVDVTATVAHIVQLKSNKCTFHGGWWLHR